MLHSLNSFYIVQVILMQMSIFFHTSLDEEIPCHGAIEATLT